MSLQLSPFLPFNRRPIVYLHATFPLPNGYSNLKTKNHMFTSKYLTTVFQYLMKTLIILFFLEIVLAICLLYLIWFSKIILHCHQMYFYPWGTHISWSTPSALLLTPYSVGCFHLRTSFFTQSPVILSSVTQRPLFVLKHPKFSYTCLQKTHWKLPYIFVTKRPFLFLVNFVTERPLLFKCLMYASLSKSCAPGISPPLSILSQWKSVSPTEVLP